MGIPINSAHILLQGTLGGGEIFQTGWWYTGVVPLSETDANTAASQWAAIFNAHNNGIKALLHTDSAYTTVKVYSYPTGGPTATYIGQALLAGQSGTGTNALPDQVCCVVTERTGFSGRRNRGRLYLPANGAAMNLPHQLSGVSVTNAVNDVAAIFNQFNLTGTPNSRVVVMSGVGTTGRSVTSVSGDQRPDIQRRRANKQAVGTTTTVVVTNG